MKCYLKVICFSIVIFSCEKKELEIFKIIDPSWTLKELNFNHNGQERGYNLYKPKFLTENSPLVLLLHGQKSNVNDIMEYSAMNTVADNGNFMVCYPQGSISPITNNSHWNSNLEISDIDDVDFLSKLALKIQKDFNLNTENIFVAGMSNGGFMAYTIACEKPDIFNSIASVAGTMSGYDWKNCSPIERIPVLQISGTKDMTVPYDGSMDTKYGWGGAPNIEKVIKFWSDLNLCSKEEIVNFNDINKSDGSTVELTKKIGKDGKIEVWFYKIIGGGHDWPGWTRNWGNKDINTSSEIWKFFKKHLR